MFLFLLLFCFFGGGDCRRNGRNERRCINVLLCYLILAGFSSALVITALLSAPVIAQGAIDAVRLEAEGPGTPAANDGGAGGTLLRRIVSARAFFTHMKHCCDRPKEMWCGLCFVRWMKVISWKSLSGGTILNLYLNSAPLSCKSVSPSAERRTKFRW